MFTVNVVFYYILHMITKWSKYLASTYCNCDITEIEGYEDAIASDEKYTCHHVLEYKFRMDELIAMNMYFKVSPEFLIWMPSSVHRNNSTLHAGTRCKRKSVSAEVRAKLSATHKGKKRSPEFCKKMSEQRKGENNPMYGKRNKLVNGKRIFY